MNRDALIVVGIGIGAWMLAKRAAAPAIDNTILDARDALAQDGQGPVDNTILDARDAWAQGIDTTPVDNTILDARDAWAQGISTPAVQSESFFDQVKGWLGSLIGTSYWGDQMRWTEASIPAQYLQPIRTAEAQYGLPRNLLARQLWQESRYNPNAVNAVTGAIGIAQFMPATAADFGIDPRNPLQAIDAAGKYMRQLYNTTGSWLLALAAYNWGIGNVLRKGIGSAPTETRQYYSQILADIGMSNTTA